MRAELLGRQEVVPFDRALRDEAQGTFTQLRDAAQAPLRSCPEVPREVVDDLVGRLKELAR